MKKLDLNLLPIALALYEHLRPEAALAPPLRQRVAHVWLRDQLAAVFKDHHWLEPPVGPPPFLES